MFKHLLAITGLFLIILLFISQLLGINYWNLSFPLTYLLYVFIYIYIMPGYRLKKSLSAERLNLNLKLANLEPPKTLWPFEKKFLTISAIILTFITFIVWNNISFIKEYVQTLLLTEYPAIKIEYAAYSNKSPSFADLTLKEQEINIDHGAHLTIFLKNKKPNTKWQIEVDAQAKSIETGELLKSTSRNFEIPNNGNLSHSMLTLYEMLQKSPKAFVKFNFRIYNILQKDKYLLQLNASPIPAPIVELKLNSTRSDAESGDGVTLTLGVNVTSTVPLSLVELQVRTKGGFHFNKTLGEFAGNAELSFDTQTAEINTMGIPFVIKDTLFIKAVAHTVVNELQGESQELSLKVNNPEEIRQNIIDKLTEAMQIMQNNKLSTEQMKEEMQQKLSEALQEAQKMNQKQVLQNALKNAQNKVSEIKQKQDAAHKQAMQKIQSMLNSLQRQQKMSQVSNLMNRLKNLKNMVDKSPTENYPTLAKEANSLQKDADKLKQELKQMAAASSNFMSPEQQKKVDEMLKQDNTPEKLGKTADALEDEKPEPAMENVNQAMDSAQKNLANTMEMLAEAHKKAMQEAREKLTEADKSLESAKNSPLPGSGSQLGQGKKSLSETPKLEPDFNSHVNNAKNSTENSIKQQEKQNQNMRNQEIESAQGSILDALATLDEMQKSEEQMARDIEGREKRVSQELLSVQGQLDSSWRQKIMEKIATLREQGIDSDAPIIKYLESRLR